jgi:transposase
MLKAEEQMELVNLKKQGDSIRSLSRLTGRSRNTVRRYLRGGDAAATRQPAPKQPEKLDPYKQYIIERTAAAAPDVIPATVLFREIQGRGYCHARPLEAIRARACVGGSARAGWFGSRPNLDIKCRRTGPRSGKARPS